MRPLRSLLFVPGNKAAWMEKAPQYGADAIILDLEDSVPLPDKATARTLVRQAIQARAAGIRYPLVASWFDVGDLDGLAADAGRNRQLGYTGMLLIHPSHVGPVNRIFTPSAEDVAYYKGLLAAMEAGERQGTAAVTYQGAMVDIAMVKTAHEMLEFAKAVGVNV